jgi:hypothetical protein
MKSTSRGKRRSGKWITGLSLGIVCLASACTYNAEYAPETTDSGAIRLNKDITPLGHNLSVRGLSKLTHRATVLGIMCSAHKYNDVFSPYFAAYAEALDANGDLTVLKDGAPSPTDGIVIAIQEARSDFRCVQTSTFKGECLARKVVVVDYGLSGGETTHRRYEVDGDEPVKGCGFFNETLSAMGTRIMEEIESDLRTLDQASS